MRYRLLIALLLLSFVGCIKEPGFEPVAQGGGGSFVLSIESFSDKTLVATRSVGGDSQILRGFVFFYDAATGGFKGCESIEDLSLEQSGSTVSFEAGTEYSTRDKIIAVFNYDQNAALPADFSAVNFRNIEEYFPISADYLAEVEEDMNSETYALGVPMYLNDFTDSDRAVREVYRSVARMELFIKQGLKIEHDSHAHVIGVEDLEFAVINAASTGAVAGALSAEDMAEECFDVDSFDGVFPHSLTMYNTKAEDTANKIYLQSFPYSTRAINGRTLDANEFDKDRFAIILKHADKNHYEDRPLSEPRYYKLNLLDKATSTFFDVKDNHSYRVIITAVNSRGYATLKEACEMPPSNIEYEIYDDKGGLTYSNGQYAISMDEILSYDEVLVYGANQTTLEFNNIRYVLPEGGQMDGSTFDTNEVSFSILSDDKGLIVDTKNEFGNSGTGVLTADGKSITVTLEGEGECSIGLRIRLGNLEMGRDKITIKKIAANGEGDGSFDAHPNHIEIEGQKLVPGSWQSDDIDFGARDSSSACDDIGDGGMVIYMGENATPTGYRTMDGYVSGESSKDSYPVFSPKTRRGYYAYEDAAGETRKVMIQLDQLAPFYLGHFGSAASEESLYHYDGLICEKIEEIGRKDWSGTIFSTNGVMGWSKKAKTYYKGEIWGDFLHHGKRYKNLVEGLEITRSIVENNTSEDELPLAARYCYMKNDVNGNGVIDDNEEIVWYLPAQNQMLAMWINMNVFDTEIDLFKLNNITGRDSRPYYWSCSEVDELADCKYTLPQNFDSHVWMFNMLEGQGDFGDKAATEWAHNHVRCVRGL